MKRTTVRLDERLLGQAKKLAAENGTTLTALIEDGLREVVNRRGTPRRQAKRGVIPTFGGNGLRPGVNLDDSASLLDVMEGL